MITIIRKSEIIWTVGLLLLIPMWIGFAPVWYNWYAMPENGHWMKWLYDVLNGRWLVNVPVCIVGGYCVFRWCSRIWKDNDRRYYRIIMPLLGIVVLYCESTVEYAKVIWSLDYRFVFTLYFVAPLLTLVVKGLYKKFIFHNENEGATKTEDGGQEKQKDNSKKKGFSDDETEDTDIPEALKKYAGEIIERLLVTKIDKHSYALGVTGEWGVGKTTFLGVLKEKIAGRAEIVEFNPWMCSSPEQVTSDFFASLRHQLSPKYSTLSHSIKEYAKYVNNFTFTHPAISMEMILPVNEESLFERKKTLSQKFSKLPHPVVVIIDDVDRLERDEVFEVLRLIRNTADLSNVIYIVAYDKEYVTCVLEEKNIKDSSAYLEKIFPVEVHLPKVEDHLVWTTLKDEIKAQSTVGNSFADELFKRLDTNDKELILRILDNYRRAKRFARLYMLNVSYVHEQANGELKWLDMFWLELLQMYDKKSYDILSEDSSALLYRGEERYYVRDGVIRPATEKDKNKFVGEPFWKEETPHILDKLFGRYTKTSKLSVCFPENYDKFFTMSVSKFRLSVQEANQIFAEGINADELVGKWVDEGKYFNSITYQLGQLNVNKLNDKQLKKYLYGILGFCMKVAPYRNNYAWEVKKMLWDERYAVGVDKKAHDIVLECFGLKMKDNALLPYLSQELNRLYTTRVFDPEGREESKKALVISNKEIEELLVQLMKTFLDGHPEISALDLMKEKGLLPYVFKHCCVTVTDAMQSENYCENKQVAFDTVIEHFSKKKDKPTKEEYDKAMGALFSVETPVFDNPYDEDQYWDYASEAYENKMQEYFGSSYDNEVDGKLNEFKVKCFAVKKVADGEIKEAPVKETE